MYLDKVIAKLLFFSVGHVQDVQQLQFVKNLLSVSVYLCVIFSMTLERSCFFNILYCVSIYIVIITFTIIFAQVYFYTECLDHLYRYSLSRGR